MKQQWKSSAICNRRGRPIRSFQFVGNKIFISSQTLQMIEQNEDGSQTSSILYCEDTFENIGCLVSDGQSVYFCSQEQNSILKYDIDQKTISKFCGNGNEEDDSIEQVVFNRPTGITMKNGDLFLTECHGITRISMQKRTVETLAGEMRVGYVDGDKDDARFFQPRGIVVADDGAIYIADCFNHSIRKFKDGMTTSIKNATHENGLVYPKGLSLDIDGTLVVACQDWLVRVDPTKETCTPFYKIHAESVQANGWEIFVGSTSLIRLRHAWAVQRWFWIGYMKEEASYCLFPLLPKEIIREIADKVHQF